MKLSPNWYYSEIKQVGIDYSDIQEVQAYDLRMQKIRDIQKETENAKAAINLNKSHSLLEIGTGTGEFAVEISRHCKKVYAIDISPAMIEVARKKAKLQRRDNIEFFHAGFLSYQHQGEPLDAVVSQLVLHHLPDFWKFLALKRIFQMLRKGGKFYLRDVVFPSVDDYVSFFNQLIDKIRLSAGEEIAAEVEIHIREEYSTLDWIMEDLLIRTGFKIEQADYYDEFLAVYVCTK
ncbi:MAG: class I SAM-dependent methyltransferase [Bacillota bacterium]|nr:class I SAM-dependent methyltransferase [Bacillota bacterium]